jgi:hypothetical protein
MSNLARPDHLAAHHVKLIQQAFERCLRALSHDIAHRFTLLHRVALVSVVVLTSEAKVAKT